MNSPKSPVGTVGPRNPVPSSSMLQKLLEEIRTTDVPSVLQSQDVLGVNSRIRAISSRTTPSVWIGGNHIAQDARQKLRAADLARYRKNERSDKSTHSTCMRKSDLRPSHSGARLNPTKTTSAPQNSEVNVPRRTEGDRNNSSRSGLPAQVSPKHTKPTLGCLHLPGLASVDSGLCWVNEFNAPRESPPIFCDVGSEISSTPSPTEPPTSAISSALTDSSTYTNIDLHRHSDLELRSFTKRPLSGAESPQILPKKCRMLTPPDPKIEPVISLKCIRKPSHHSFDDSCQLIHDSPITHCPSPLSLQPEIASAQSFPSVSVTPVRSSTRRASLSIREDSPRPEETPPFARALHLVDTEISIFKKTHGDECEERPLCLWCFRRHGRFSRMGEHGYELCQGEDVLEGHYWEGYGDSPE